MNKRESTSFVAVLYFVEDFEGWDYEVSVDKTVAEEFSVSKSISDMVTSTLDYITSTFAPPSTLLTRTTTESTTVETTTSSTTTTASSSVQAEENENSVKIKTFKPQNSTGNSAAAFKHSFAKNVTAFKSPNLNSNSVRIHPFLASRKLKAQNEKVESLKAPSFNLNRNNFFKPRPAKQNTSSSENSIINETTTPVNQNSGVSETTDSTDNASEEIPTTKAPVKQTALQKLLSQRASEAKNKGRSNSIANTKSNLKSSINLIKPKISKRPNERPKFGLSPRFQQKKKLSFEDLAQKQTSNTKSSFSPSAATTDATTSFIDSTTESTRTSSRFRPFGGSSRTTKARPTLGTTKPKTSRTTLSASKRLSGLRNRNKSSQKPSIKPFDLDAAPTCSPLGDVLVRCLLVVLDLLPTNLDLVLWRDG